MDMKNTLQETVTEAVSAVNSLALTQANEIVSKFLTDNPNAVELIVEHINQSSAQRAAYSIQILFHIEELLKDALRLNSLALLQNACAVAVDQIKLYREAVTVAASSKKCK